MRKPTKVRENEDMKLSLILGLCQNVLAREIVLVHGETLELSCNLIDQPQLERDYDVIWKRNGDPVSGGDLIELVRPNAKSSDSGDYTCVYHDENGFGRVSKPIKVLVLDEITLDAAERKVIGYLSGSVQLTCQTHVENVIVKWFKNNELIVNSNRIRHLPDGSIELTDLGRLDRGNYVCHAELRGLKGTQSVDLDVQPSIIEKDAPKLDPKPPKSVNVGEGEALFIPCHAFDRSPDSSVLDIEWLLPNG